MKSLVLINTILILLFGISLFFVNKKSLQLINALKKTEADNQYYYIARQRVNETNVQLNNLTTIKDELKKRYPSEKEIDTFFSTVNALASSHHVDASFGSSTTPTEGADPAAGSLSFDLTLHAGSLEDIQSFVYDLEHGDYIISIKQFNLSYDKGSALGELNFILYVNKTT